MDEKEKKVKDQYLTRRLKQLGFNKKAVHKKFTIPKDSPYYTEKCDSNAEKFGLTFFTGDDKDNIQIHYFKPQGLSRYHFKKKANKWPEHFIRTRIQNPAGDIPKYLSPKGSGLAPFFAPELLDLYINMHEIETLVITEGEFKAFKGCKHGLHVIGIPSIHGFYSNDASGSIHDDIIDFISVCKVENVIFLTDADTLVVKYKKDKDLAKRQFSFYKAVEHFRSSLDRCLANPNTRLKNVYFNHIRTKYHEDAKGLDDLLVKFKGKEKQVVDDLLQLEHAERFFDGFKITDGKYKHVWNHFGLNNETDFYNTYKEHIGSREFRFGKRVYEYDGENVVYLQHEDTSKYMRIGADWMKEIELRNKHDQIEKQLVAWKIGEIKRDYKDYPDFLDNIPKYDGFCSEPDFSPGYKKVHHELLNIYAPCIHTLEPGSIDTTIKFLKHIFGGEADHENQILGDPFTVALDYLTLQFQKPKQMLPVPVLVSKEYGTGKSTFLKWLQAIYVGNMAILNNELFKMNFNSHYITKYVIAIDEGFLDVDKKSEKERLKQLVTADVMYLQNKGIDLKAFNYYGKLIICSNDADDVMKMEHGEDRWFVIKVPVPKENDPHLEKKLHQEIPAWLDFLSKREVFHPEKERFWFDKKHIITEQYNIIVKQTKTRNEHIIEELLSDMFLTFGLKEIKMNSNYILEKLKNIKYKMDTHDLKRVLEQKRGLKKMGRHRYDVPNFLDPKGSIINYVKRNDRPYLFHYKDWLDEDQIDEFENLEHQPVIDFEKVGDDDVF